MSLVIKQSKCKFPCPRASWDAVTLYAIGRAGLMPEACTNARLAGLPGLAELGPHELRAFDHRFQFLERHLARQVLHPAVGRDDDVFRRDERQGAADARGDFLR